MLLHRSQLPPIGRPAVTRPAPPAATMGRIQRSLALVSGDHTRYNIESVDTQTRYLESSYTHTIDIKRVDSALDIKVDSHTRYLECCCARCYIAHLHQCSSGQALSRLLSVGSSGQSSSMTTSRDCNTDPAPEHRS